MEQRRKALIIGVRLNDQDGFQESMEELQNLAEACEMEVAGQVEQNLKSINKAYYIGTGKVKEVAAASDELGAEVVIFDHELSPSQLRNLERALERDIMDRTSLILEIFSQRARTREAKLQVEVARLQYMLPRLAGLNEALDRQGGGGVGTTNRGAGEKKIVLDRRRIEGKIAELSRELETIENERQTQRKKRNRSGLPKVALVGYTNAGKSTLMNAMIDLSQKPDSKKVFEKDMLFATLETSVRNISLQDKNEFLLSDTVGFVSKLPHNLIKAFRSTLEEVRDADLLLHVVDASSPDCEHHREVTLETLKQIGAGEIQTIHVYNKAELTSIRIPLVRDDTIYLSARDKTGLEDLIQMIGSRVFQQHVECRMLIPYDQSRVVAYFNENANVKETRYESEGVLLTMVCKETDLERYKQYQQ